VPALPALPDVPAVAKLDPHLLGRFQTLPRPRVPEREGGEPGTALPRAPGAMVSARLRASFEMHDDEEAFARALLAHRKNLWVFRANQRASCGDFVLVDMSSPRPCSRRVWVVELKRGQALLEGGGGAGFQLVRHRAALDELARRYGVVPLGITCRLLVGDATAVLAALAVLGGGGGGGGTGGGAGWRGRAA
jgi:hypothetical protein